MHYRLDGTANEDGRVIDDAVVHAFGELFLEFGHLCPHLVGHVDGIGAGALEDRQGYRWLVVEQRTQRVLTGTQFDPGNVLEAGDLTIVCRTNDDIFELFLGYQATLGVHRHLEAGGVGRRWRAQLAGSDLTVLFANGIDHIGGSEVARRGLVRVQPHTQRVFAHAEQLHVTDTVEPRQFVLDVQGGVVGQVKHVVALIGRGQVHHHGQVGRGLVHGDADAGHFFGQLGLGTGHAVLHLHLGVVQVGAQREGEGQGQLAVGSGLRGHVQHVLDAGDGLLQRRGHGFADHLGVGAGESSAYHHGGRDHFRVFADRQLEQRDGTGDQDHQ